MPVFYRIHPSPHHGAQEGQMNTQQVSPAIAEFAIQELARLREVNAELREELEEIAFALSRPMGKPHTILEDHCARKARAALAKSREAA